eukprot:8409583-Pyramimonas_sp.AAC.1
MFSALLCWTISTSNGLRTTPKYNFRSDPIPIIEKYSAIVDRMRVEGLSPGHAKKCIPTIVVFTFPPCSGSEGRI